MNKLTVVTSVMMILMGLVTAEARDAQLAGNAAASQTVKKQTVCPVMGGAINTGIYADANGKRVYFCCNGCPAEFKKDPAKYIAKLEKEGITLDKTPAADPTKKQTTDAGAATAEDHNHSAKQGGGCCRM